MSDAIGKFASRTTLGLVALLLGAAVSSGAPNGNVDVDGDLVPDATDNCLPRSYSDYDMEIAKNPARNGRQHDSDGDGIGNRCDHDYNNSGTVTIADVGFFSFVCYGAFDPERHDGPSNDIGWEVSSDKIWSHAEVADYNDDGYVDDQDLDALLGAYGLPPGPSNDLPSRTRRR